MHPLPIKGSQHHLPNCSRQNGVSETQDPKVEKVWEMLGQSKSSKILYCGNSQSLQYANTILHEFSKSGESVHCFPNFESSEHNPTPITEYIITTLLNVDC